MKKNIHPKYYREINVTCSCGNTFTIGGSTLENIRTEYCYKCHPAYTGEQKVADVTSKIKKFKTRLKKTEQRKKQIEAIERRRLKKKEMRSLKKEITLRDILKSMKK